MRLLATSLSSLVSADPASLPWSYRYEEEARTGGAHFLRHTLLRPVVPVQLVGPVGVTQRLVSLVDSGCDHVLAPLWVAETIGVEPAEDREVQIGIGGASRAARFADVDARLLEPGNGPTDPGASAYLEWRCEIGFFMHWPDPSWLLLLGQVGFFDQFTVTMNRHAQALGIEPYHVFDDRFAAPPRASSPPGAPRFSP